MRAHDREGVRVVVGEVVDHAAGARVHVAAAELLGGDDLARRGLHQRRAAEEDRALVADDDALVRHRRDVGAAGRARAHHAGDLRDAAGRQVGLVEEDPAEVLLVGEHVVLHRQERAAGVDEVDARQPVVGGDGLRAEVLLHGDRVVGAALDRRVVGDDHGLPAADPADAGDDAGARHSLLCVVHPGRGQWAQLEERAAGVEQPVHPVTDQQLAPRGVLLACRLRPAQAYDGQPLAQVGDEVPHLLCHPARLAIINLWGQRLGDGRVVTMSSLRWQCVIVDCADPEPVASFWAAALGWRRTHTSDDGGEIVLEPPEGSREDGVSPGPVVHPGSRPDARQEQAAPRRSSDRPSCRGSAPRGARRHSGRCRPGPAPRCVVDRDGGRRGQRVLRAPRLHGGGAGDAPRRLRNNGPMVGVLAV